MLKLPRSLAAWQGPRFAQILKAELLGCDRSALPLQAGLSHSSMALEDEVSFVFLRAQAHGEEIRARLGIMYQGLIAGCQCADDPAPADTLAEYCEVWVVINPRNGEARIELAD